MKKTQAQQQTQAQQNPNQNQVQGGDAMKKTQAQQNPNQNQDAMIYFVTFVNKVDSQIAKEVIKSLRERFPMKRPMFIAKPPKGRRVVLNINETLVILTFPYTLKNPDKQEQPPQSPESPSGFTLTELIKKK